MKVKIYYKILALGLAIIMASSTFAMTMREIEYTCPIGNEKFRQAIPMSGTAFGMRTDFMKIGAISSPWLLPNAHAIILLCFKISLRMKKLLHSLRLLPVQNF